MGLFGADHGRIGKIENLIGAGSIFRGSLRCRGAVRIDGAVEGDVVSEDGVVLGPSGFVRGNVHAGSIVVGGKITGGAYARRRVEVLPGGQVLGDVRAPQIAVADGVVLSARGDPHTQRIHPAARP